MSKSDSLLDQSERTPSLLQKAGLEVAAREGLKPDMTPRQCLEVLISRGNLLDAVRLLAWTLDRREAVWWVSLCAREALLPTDLPQEQAAIELAQRWVAGPTEHNRRAAEAAAAAVDYGTPGGCAAVAAFWSRGSLAPPNVAAVPAAEHLLPRSVTNGVQLAAIKAGPDKIPQRLQHFLQLGVAVGEGKNRWKEEPPTPKPAVRPQPVPPRPIPGKR